MAGPLQLLDQLISQQPETMKPVLNQIGSMLKSSGLAFDAHVSDFKTHISDNDMLFGQIQDQIRALADRATDIETWKLQTQSDGAALRDRLTAVEQSLSATASISEQKFETVVQIVNALGANTQQTIAQLGDMKMSIDHLEIATSSGGRVGSSAHPTHHGLRNDFSYREITKFGNVEHDDFRHWRESVRDLCELRAEGLEALDWAVLSRTELTAETVQAAGFSDFSRELWSSLGAKTKESPWRLRLAIADRNGLEH